MKVWIFVEGRSDVLALEALCGGWKQELGKKGWGIRPIPLDNKHKYLRKIGPRATEKLKNDQRDLVVGLPDLYPNQGFAAEYEHADLEQLNDIQNRLVGQNLKRLVKKADFNSHIERFYASAFKHDLEVLLLAASSQLGARLNVSSESAGLRRPPEEQNQDRPPKRVVEELFRRHLKRAYRENTDSNVVLRDADLREIAMRCPTFGAMIDWIGERTGVRAY